MTEELRDPWGPLVAGVVGGLAWAVGTPVAAAVAVGAVVYGVKAAVGSLVGPGDDGPAEPPRPHPGSPAALWLRRGESAVLALDDMARSRGTTPAETATARAAEDWCLDNVTVPLASMARIGRDTPFWVRVDYRVQERSSTQGAEDSTFTLQTLIDILSRRREDQDKAKSVEGGPFRVGN